MLISATEEEEKESYSCVHFHSAVVQPQRQIIWELKCFLKRQQFAEHIYSIIEH